MHSGPARPAASVERRSRLLVNRDFALLWSGQAISVIGDFVFNTTLVIWIGLELAKGQSWAPLAVSGIFLASAIPMIAVGPVAGVFVDRWDKRRTMIAMDVVRALLVAALVLATGIVPLPRLQSGQLPLAWRLGLIYATVFIVNVCDRFFRPASLALIGDIVPTAEQPRAMSLIQASFSLAIIIGPPLAAPLLIVFGPEWALLINAASFVVSVLTLLAIRAPRAARSVAPGQRGSFLRELGAGVRLLLGSRFLTTVIVAAMIVMLGGGALNALDVFFTTQNLHAPGSMYGLLGAAQGVGMIAGSLLLAALAQRIGLVRLIWTSIIGLGLVVLVYARLTSLVPALVALFVLGLPLSGVNVAIAPLVLQVTPREYVGRITAMLDPVIMIATVVGTALAGYVDSTVLRGFHAVVLGVAFGPVDTIFMGAGVLAVLGGLYAMVGLRGIQLPVAEAEPAPVAAAASDGLAERGLGDA
jgi:MFS family permease